jgi:hypothetical protein
MAKRQSPKPETQTLKPNLFVDPDTFEIVVVGIRGLPQALKENVPQIVVKPPVWLPTKVSWLFIFLVLSIIATQGMLAWKGLTSGYNVEYCLKLRVKGVDISNYLNLTKP